MCIRLTFLWVVLKSNKRTTNNHVENRNSFWLGVKSTHHHYHRTNKEALKTRFKAKKNFFFSVAATTIKFNTHSHWLSIGKLIHLSAFLHIHTHTQQQQEKREKGNWKKITAMSKLIWYIFFVSLPFSVYAIDLSRLYGHLRPPVQKRSGKWHYLYFIVLFPESLFSSFS